MKKIISVLLSIMIILSLVQTVTFAKTGNLLENGDFEDPNFVPCETYGPSNLILVKSDYAQAGSGGLLCYERMGKYSTVKFNVLNLMAKSGPGTYTFTASIRLNESGKTAKALLALNIGGANGKDSFLVSPQAEITDKWQTFTFTKPLSEEMLYESTHIWLYPQVEGNGNADFCLDNISIVKDGEINGHERTDVTETKRPEVTTVGAIRWDAWYGEAGSVGKQVAKTLSPAKYHFRAPFFSTVNGDGTISYPEEYTQELFDREMEYAIDAGIDYFAYNWYSDGMQKARQLHVTSKYKNDVKMCVILGGASSDYTKSEMAKLLQDECYMTVLGGRPLMYYFADAKSATEDIKYYQALCRKLNIPEPYAVVMNLSANATAATGADAIGQYAIAGSKGESFKSLTEHAVSLRTSFGLSGLPFVPTVTTGWNAVTRFENPVSWITSSADSWAEYATAEEIYEHLKETLDYMQTPAAKSKTTPNTVLIYAWNEHDEGGWICPTLAVDEDGNQLFNEDGTKQIDTSRLEAVKKAISEYKSSISAEPENVKDKNVLLPVLIGVGITAVVAITVITVSRRKKKNEN